MRRTRTGLKPQNARSVLPDCGAFVGIIEASSGGREDHPPLAAQSPHSSHRRNGGSVQHGLSVAIEDSASPKRHRAADKR
mgnify:CR=1 FL=1